MDKRLEETLQNCKRSCQKITIFKIETKQNNQSDILLPKNEGISIKHHHFLVHGIFVSFLASARLFFARGLLLASCLAEQCEEGPAVEQKILRMICSCYFFLKKNIFYHFLLGFWLQGIGIKLIQRVVEHWLVR